MGGGWEESGGSVGGVVLGSGGFGANAEMRRKYIPQADAGWSLQPEGSQGDGVTMGVSVGGTINEGNAANAIWVPASAMTREDGTLAKFPSLAFDRHRSEGRRVGQEGFSQGSSRWVPST